MKGVKKSHLVKVGASAGSGKTYWLVSEFFRLLGQGAPLDSQIHSSCLKNGAGPPLSRILAITFTNAAAMEMRERLLERLKKAALGKEKEDEALPDKDQAQKWLETILADYSSLNFRTIDSLLHLLARSSPLELGINPDFEISFSLEEIFSPWLEELFEQSRNNGELRQLFSDTFRLVLETTTFKGFLSGGKVQEKIMQALEPLLLGKFDKIPDRSALQNKLAELKAAQEQAENEITLLSQNLLDIADGHSLVLNATARSSIRKLADGAFPDNKTGYANRPDFASLCNKVDKKPQQIPAEINPVFISWTEILANYYDKLLPKARLLEKGITLLSLFTIAQMLRDRFLENRETLKQLPSCLVPGFAESLMRAEQGVSDAICKLGVRLTHFLVDEFQDTSHEQWSALKALVLEALSSGGSLAAVGDGKQSIYNWRGGDPEIFASLLHDPELTAIENAPLQLQLKSNRRSAEKIIAHNNAIFSVLAVPEQAEAALSYLLPDKISSACKEDLAKKTAAIYADAFQETASKDKGPEIVECLDLVVGKGENAWEKALNATADLVVNSLLPRHAPEDILILCRSNDNCLDVAKKLTSRNVPVITENSLLLRDHPLVIQAVALLEFLTDQSSDIAFWTLATSSILATHPEWLPHDTDELENWLASLAMPKASNVAKEFAAAFPELWEKFFSPLLARKSAISVYDLVAEWFRYLDVEKRFHEDQTFIRRFLEILHSAEENGANSPALFLDVWKKAGEEEKAPMPDNANAVTIMTVHKAKGLQNKVVIVPKTSFEPLPTSELGVVEIDGIQLPAAFSSDATGSKYEEAYGKQALELLNILYVAFTRAEDELYYFTLNKEKKEDKGDPPSLMHYLQAKSGLNIPQISISKEEPDQKNDKIAEEPSYTAKPLEQGWQPMAWLPRPNFYRAHPVNTGLTAVERGNFIHRCLEKINFSHESASDVELAFNDVLREARYFIPEEEREHLLESLKWFASLPFTPGWIKNGLREQSLMTADGRLLRPDLIVAGKNEALVVDYKTGEPDPGHIRQVREYILNLEETGAFPQKITGIIVYLDKRSFMRITKTTRGKLSAMPGLPHD